MVGVLALALILLFAGERGYDRLDSVRTMEGAKAAMRAEYPKLEAVDVQSRIFFGFKSIETSEGRDGPILLVDVRTEEEYEVSRILAAERFETSEGIRERFENHPFRPDRIIVYDSLGFRSAKVAEELRESGLTNVAYLEGGIFAWANAGLPLVDANGEATSLVHPFNRIWGRLLDEERRAPLPE